MSGRLAGKVALVTGAASSGAGIGVGHASAVLFAREGASVLLVNRSVQHADELRRHIEDEGGIAASFGADVADEAQVRAMVDAAMERFGQLNILLNNVGIGGPGTATTVSDEVWDSVMRVNLKGTLWCCKHAIPRMIESGGGSIINMSTVAAIRGARRGDVGFAAYSASKAGVIGLTRSIAADYATSGVRANCIIAGMVNTPRVAKYGEAAREKRRLAVPLRSEGTAWDIAWAAVYLASNESRWVTGATIPVDGGQLHLTEFPI